MDPLAIIHTFGTHLASVAGDEAVKTLIDGALDPLKTMLSKEASKALGLPSKGDEFEDFRIELERIKDTLGAIEAFLSVDANEGVAWEIIRREIDEPSAKRFVRDAFEVSSCSTLESKRLLIGTLIAKRLATRTDSQDEILLRRALSTIRDLTENQLQLLAAISLVHGPAIDESIAMSRDRDKLEHELKVTYFKIVRRYKNTLNLSEREFGAIESVGAVRLRDDTGALLVSEPASSFDHWMHQIGIEPYEGMLAPE